MDDFFEIILDEQDGGRKDLSIFVPEGMEDGDISDTEAVGDLIIGAEAILLYSEIELGLSDEGFILSDGSINDVVIIDELT